MLDADLARLYGVETKQLKRQVNRNKDRSPSDFLFQLTRPELEQLRSRQGTEQQWGGVRYPPYAFTEQGIAMLSSVLHGRQAVQVNVQIMRTFVRLRALVTSHEGLARRLAALEREYDQRFKIVFDAIRQLMNPPGPSKGKIGFRNRRDT